MTEREQSWEDKINGNKKRVRFAFGDDGSAGKEERRKSPRLAVRK